MNDRRTEHASRRYVLRAGLALLATGFTSVVALAQGGSKAAQDLVQYRDKPNGAAKCNGCVSFVAPNACKAVAGKIDPEGWCLLYAPKKP
jgi:hypothetical protein